jgi:hypothetical protein
VALSFPGLSAPAQAPARLRGPPINCRPIPELERTILPFSYPAFRTDFATTGFERITLVKALQHVKLTSATKTLVESYFKELAKDLRSTDTAPAWDNVFGHYVAAVLISCLRTPRKKLTHDLYPGGWYWRGWSQKYAGWLDDDEFGINEQARSTFWDELISGEFAESSKLIDDFIGDDESDEA